MQILSRLPPPPRVCFAAPTQMVPELRKSSGRGSLIVLILKKCRDGVCIQVDIVEGVHDYM